MAQTKTATKNKTELKYPKRYNVVLHNDNHTPFDFVIQILIEIFNHNIESAKVVTMSVHEKGTGIAGTYSKEVAEQKTVEATSIARMQGYPIQLTVEEA